VNTIFHPGLTTCIPLGLYAAYNCHFCKKRTE